MQILSHVVMSGCSMGGGVPGVGAYNGLATNVTTLKTDFPVRGLNGTAVNVSSAHLTHAYTAIDLAVVHKTCRMDSTTC